MKAIGITGGIGAGKSQVIQYVKEKYCCEVILADEVAHMLKEPGNVCYQPLIDLLGKGVVDENQNIDRVKMAGLIFADEEILKKVNQIIHPAVKQFIKDKVVRERKADRLDFVFVEAALLLEEHYEEILDEIWYVYAEDDCRRERLRKSRNYSQEKITSIFKKQLQDEEFRMRCKVVIENSNSLVQAYQQIDEKLEEYLWQRVKNIQDN